MTQPPTLDESLVLYEQLRLIRRSEEYIIQHYSSDEMKTPMHMSMGQEPAAVGVCAVLDERDTVWGYYRSHALYLSRTGDTDTFFSELYGRATGTAEGKAGSMHLASPERGYMMSSAIVAGSIPPTLGAAFANKTRKNGAIAVVFFGDGAMDEGGFWESLNAACAMRLPVLFVCEDNGMAVHTGVEVRRGYHSVAGLLASLDCTFLADDTNDVESIRARAGEAVAAIRETGKPAFLHIRCYRYLEHVGVNYDFHDNYRPIEEFEDWKARDGVALQRERVIGLGVPVAKVDQIEVELDARIERSIALARETPHPGPDALYRGVFLASD